MVRPERTPAVAPTRSATFGRVAALAVLVAISATGCSGDQILRFGWPVGVTPQAEQMRVLWTWMVVAALAVGVIVWGLIFWVTVFHRKKNGSEANEELPRQFQYNVPLELFTVVTPLIMVCVLFFFTATTESRVLDKTPNPDVTVDVIAFQWNWEFRYPKEPVDAMGQPVSTIGNSGEIPLLVLPTGKVIQYNLRSTDVIHSFWVPEFHFKRDVMPFPEKNNQDMSFQNSIDHEGSFVGRCAELCGTYHSVMNFEVRALSPDKYAQYIHLRGQVNPKTARPNTAAEALAAMNCGELCTPHAVTTQPFNTDRTARTASG